MKKFSSKFKISIILMLFGLNIVFSQVDFNPSISNLISNAVSFTTSGSSNGVDTYKTLRYTIPFYQSTFSNQIRFSHYGGNYACNFPNTSNPTTRLQVGNSSNPTTYTSTNILDYTITANCPTQITYVFFDLRFLCLTNQNPGDIYQVSRIQKIRVEIVKEATPNLNLTLSRYCAINTHTGLLNGAMNIQASGTYTNASYLFLRTTNNANTCLAANEFNVANLGSPTLPSNSITNVTFYSCSSSTTYTVRLYYKRLNLNGVLVEYEIPSGSYGWTNYSYTKTVKNCLNPIGQIQIQKSKLQLSPNPVKENLNLKLEDNEKMISIKIYDYSGVLVKTHISNSNTDIINLQELKRGFYFIEILTENGIVNDKIIKE